MPDTNILDVETLKGQDSLTESQEQAIRDQVIADRKKRESGEDDKDESNHDDEGDSQDETENEDVEGDGSKKEGNKESDESGESGESDESDDDDDESGKTEDDDSEDDDATKEKKAQEKKESKPTKEDVETEIAEYAEANGIDEVDAREIVEGVHGIINKYGNDKKKIAFAYRNLQSHTSKVDEENRSIKKEIEFLNNKMSETSLFPKTVFFEGKEYSVDEFQDMAIESYRKEYPDKTEDLEDSEVWKMAYSELDKNMATIRAQRQQEISKQASKKRVELISTLTASHQRFLPDIKPMLDQMSNIQILNPKFALDDLIALAKGRRYDEDIKKIKEKEFKKGSEQAKILGEKASVSKGSSTKSKTKNTVLSSHEMILARNMFGGSGLSDDEMNKYYLDWKKNKERIDSRSK